MKNKFLSAIKAAPLWALVILVFCTVFSTVKHLTDWPPFLSQLGILAAGLGLGLLAAGYGLVKEAKAAKTLIKSNTLQPSALQFEPATNGPTGPRWYYKANNQIIVSVAAGRWIIADFRGDRIKETLIGAMESQEQLDEQLNRILGK